MKKQIIVLFIILSCGFNEAFCQWNTIGNNIYNTNSGFVGIGNNVPTTLLYVARNMTEPAITVRNMGGSGGATYTMIDDGSGANWKFKATLSGGFKIRDHGNGLDVIVIEPGSTANAIYINSAGYIGLGTNSPQANLHLQVSGTNAYAGIMITSTLPYGKSLTINQGTEGQLNFTNPGVVDLVTMDFNQNNVGIGAVIPDASAALEVASTTQGLLLPRMTTQQRDAIENPADGLLIFNVTSGCLNYYFEGTWKSFNATPASDFQCGEDLTVNHMAGNVAPVTKTVTYGTITNIPGENSKCWITSNLGSDHQATAMNDATEASSGWYWQFCRRQGYKHDGTTRTPNTSWNNTISEYRDWITGEDPCALELGIGWHVPTYTELWDIDHAGGWSNWNDSWNSALKIHAAGYLGNSTGNLAGRGSTGSYWSSLEYSNLQGYILYFYDVNCLMDEDLKATGNTVRCVRD